MEITKNKKKYGNQYDMAVSHGIDVVVLVQVTQKLITLLP